MNQQYNIVSRVLDNDKYIYFINCYLYKRLQIINY